VAPVDARHRAISAHLCSDPSRARVEPPGDDRGGHTLRGQLGDGLTIRVVHRAGGIEKRAVEIDGEEPEAQDEAGAGYTETWRFLLVFHS